MKQRKKSTKTKCQQTNVRGSSIFIVEVDSSRVLFTFIFWS